MKIYARKNYVSASSVDNLRLTRSSGNRYFTTYMVFDGNTHIGDLEEHDTYYVAWHLYNHGGYGNTKNFNDEADALQWLLDNADKGDLRNHG